MESDPIICYLIINDSLGMSIGKTAAQTAHASQYLMLKFFDLKEKSSEIKRMMNIIKNDNEDLLKQYKDIASQISIMSEWLNTSVTKVVLKADSKEFLKLKEEFKAEMVLVTDAGRTEIPSGSETVICLWPRRKSTCSKTIKRLQLLK